jgi:hypothetical protein
MQSSLSLLLSLSEALGAIRRLATVWQGKSRSFRFCTAPCHTDSSASSRVFVLRVKTFGQLPQASSRSLLLTKGFKRRWFGQSSSATSTVPISTGREKHFELLKTIPADRWTRDMFRAVEEEALQNKQVAEAFPLETLTNRMRVPRHSWGRMSRRVASWVGFQMSR